MGVRLVLELFILLQHRSMKGAIEADLSSTQIAGGHLEK